MVPTYFNIKLEFEAHKVDSIIQILIARKGKGYVCAVESNIVTLANRNTDYLRAVNGASVNVCSGSIVAKILGIIHNKSFQSYIAADLFLKKVQLCRYKQFFLGNSWVILDGLRENLSKIDLAIWAMPFDELPTNKVEEYDYKGIAAMINKEKPEIIWVSLPAPTQEIFMSMLLPYLRQGVLIGVGNVFNYYAGTGFVQRAPEWMLKMHYEWLFRALEHPIKNIPEYWRFVKILPGLIREENKLM